MPSGVASSCTPGLSCPTGLALVSGSAPCCTPARSPLQPRSGPLAGPCLVEREWVGQDGLAERLHAGPLSRPAGTSSILAGAALAAVQRAAGRVVGAEALIHAVLHLEQVLTTGRGLPRGRTGVIRNGLPWTCRAPTAALGCSVIKSCLLIPLTVSLVLSK